MRELKYLVTVQVPGRCDCRTPYGVRELKCDARSHARDIKARRTPYGVRELKSRL